VNSWKFFIGSVLGSETLPSRPERSSCVDGPIRFQGDIALSSVVLHQSSSPSRVGYYGTAVTKVTSVCLSPIALLPGVLERIRWDRFSLLLVAPYWPAWVWFADLISFLDSSPLEILVRTDLLCMTQLTARWVQCLNSCRSVSPPGYPPPH